MDLLADNNLCGQSILRLVSRGNAIIAEILRLSTYVPPVYQRYGHIKRGPVARAAATATTVAGGGSGGGGGMHASAKYDQILFDFAYFKTTELCEHRIETNAYLVDLDEEFRENNIDILTRFYLVFESVYKYAADLAAFLEDMEEGIFIQQTLESVLLNADGKQLISEALYLYGVALLVIDMYFEGPVRERMLVSYHRYMGSNSDSSCYIDEVCKLLRSTKFIPGQKRPPSYPEEYFSRFQLPKAFIDMVIGRLRSDDIYNQMSAYPLPEHRSTALASQAAMLFVTLFFAPDILHNQASKMREVVDKFFDDNWIITIYMGIVVNLVEAWEPYKAARTALNNIVELTMVKSIAQRCSEKIPKLTKELDMYLTEGVLVEEYVLDRIPKLMTCLRDCNVTIRWLMLHCWNGFIFSGDAAHQRCRKLREQVHSAVPNQEAIFSLLLHTSQFEHILRGLFETMLAHKLAKWEECKKECAGRMTELAEYFSGEKALTRVEKNEKLQAWFNDLATQISSLAFDDATAAGRKIVLLMQALEEVQEFHQLETSLQIKQFLGDTRKYLHQMIRTVNIKDEELVTIQLVADLSYAWQIIDSYTGYMQSSIQRDANVVVRLRSTFLKLASAMELPLVRINQANSPDLVSVSHYYSGELVAYVRNVLQIIPQSMFRLLKTIIDIQTHKLVEVPTRLEKERLKEYAQLDQRYTIARLTHDISVFTEGILGMKSTLVGVIKVDPKQLLEDGIRKELVVQVAKALDQTLTFSKKPGEFDVKLKQLADRMDGFRRSFEYIQDYVNIYGLRIWQEEISRIMDYNVQQECNLFLKNKVHDWESQYQSQAIPIPVYVSQDRESVNFMGRLAHEILRLTDTRTTVHVHQMHSWYDMKTQKEVFSIKHFAALQLAVGTFGVVGLDRLLCFKLVRELQTFSTSYQRLLDNSQHAILDEMYETLEPTNGLVLQPSKVYTFITSKCQRFWSIFQDVCLRLGQMQLIRIQIAHELNFSIQLDSSHLASALKVSNDSLIWDIEAHYRDFNQPYPAEDNPLMYELTEYLEGSGLTNPLIKIYHTAAKLGHFPLLIFIFVASQLPKLFYNKEVGALISKSKKNSLDGTPFVVGIITLLKQAHSTHTNKFLEYMGQYVRSNLKASGRDPKMSELPLEVVNVLVFLEEFCKYSKLPRSEVEKSIPSYVFDQFRL